MSGETSLRRSWAIQRRIIWALLMREVLTRYGRHNIGFMWLFVEPMLFTLGVTALWSATKSIHTTNLPIVAFAITGYSSVLLWRNMPGRCVDALELMAAERDVQIITEIEHAEFAAVRADPDALEQVVTNLLSNAAAVTVTTGATPSTPPRSSASSAGPRPTASRRASGRPCAGTSTTGAGARASPRANTGASASGSTDIRLVSSMTSMPNRSHASSRAGEGGL